VSIDLASDHRPLVEELVREAQHFCNLLDEGILRLHYGRDAAWEMELARTVRRLAADLESLKAVELPPSGRRGVRDLGRLLPALIKRWKWKHVVGPKGEEILAEKKRRFDAAERSYRAAARSHYEAWGDGKIERPKEEYRRLAEIAEAQGIAPAAPAVLREERLEKLKARVLSPHLAREFPTPLPGEHEAIESAIRRLRGLPEPDTSQPDPPARRPPAPAPSGTADSSDPIRTLPVVPQPADQLDEDAIADMLAAKGRTLEAALVRHFKGRLSTTWQDLVEVVCPDDDEDEEGRSWATVKTWVNRAHNALLDLEPPCKLRFRTTIRGHLIIKRIPPE
jgi:hypothetical protein